MSFIEIKKPNDFEVLYIMNLSLMNISARSDITIRHSAMNNDEYHQLNNWLYNIAADRDKKAFACLFNWFAPKIIRFGIQKLNTETSANELLQETMSNVWKKAHMFDAEKGQATTWVYTIMRNLTFDMLRKIKSNREDTLSDDIWPVAESTMVEDDVFSDHLLTSSLAQHIELLPEAQQTVVKYIYYRELSQEQVANELNIPLGTVKSRLRLALAKLKQQMGESS